MDKNIYTLGKLAVGIAIVAIAIAAAEQGFQTILTEQIRK